MAASSWAGVLMHLRRQELEVYRRANASSAALREYGIDVDVPDAHA